MLCIYMKCVYCTLIICKQTSMKDNKLSIYSVLCKGLKKL